MALTIKEIQNAYVAFFNRPADVAGLNYWSSYAGSSADLLNTFAQSKEYTDLFAGLNNTQVVTTIYQNLFGRDPDVVGLNYWVKQLDTKAVTIGNAAATISAGAQKSDKTIVDNKVAAATAFTAALDTSAEIVAYAGVNSTGLAAVKAWLATVTADAATLAAATGTGLTTVLGTVQSNVATETFTLTNSTDILSGSGTFNAGQVYSPGGNDRINSLQDEDSVTGTGTADVLNVTLGNTNDNGSGLVTPTLNGIETLKVTFSNTDGTGLDLQDASGLKEVDVTRVSSALADGNVATVGANAVRLLNMPSSAVSVDVSNSVAFADVNLSYRNGEIGGNETVTVGLDNAAIETLRVGAQALNTNHINNITLDVNGTSHVQNLDLVGGTVETADQTLNIQSGAAGTTFTLAAEVAPGNGNYLDDNSALVNAGRLANINITEAANVILGSVGTRAAGVTLNGAAATGNISVNIADQDGVGASSFATGSGNDTVVSNGLLGDVVTNAGADTVTVTGNVQINIAQAQFGSITTGAGADIVTVTGNLQGDVAGGAAISTGDDADTVMIGAIPAVATDSDADGDVDGVIANAATLAAARGQGSLGEEAVVDTGAGNDTVTLTGTTAGDTGGGLDGDILGSQILLGDGNDNLVFDLTNQGAVATLVAGTVDGGAGTNAMTVRGNATVTAVTAVAAADADRVTNVQTLNLISTQAVDEELYAAIEAVRANAPVPHAVNDGDDDNAGGDTTAGGEVSNAQTADYFVDVSEFTGLTAINLDNQAGVLNATPEEAVAANRFEGDAATYQLDNLTGAEAITLATVEALDSNANFDRAVIAAATTDDAVADATVNMTRATLGAVAVTLNAGVDGTAGDVTLNDRGVYNADPLVNTALISDLTVTVNADANRTLDLSDDFQVSTTINGNIAAGRTLSVVNAVSQTITSTIAANVNADIDASKNFTITTAGGNDVIDLRDDTVNGSDTINLGNGTDRIIVNDDLRGNTGADADEYFNKFTSIEELEFRGDGAPTQFTTGAAGVMEVTLDDDAFTTGVNKVVAATIVVAGAGNDVASSVDLDLGVDFERALTVDVQAGSDIDIDNDADQNLTVNVLSTDAESDNVITFTDAGIATVAVRVTVDDVAQTIAAAGTGATNDVVITNADATAEIDSITLLDAAVPTAALADGATDQVGTITLTLGAAWAQASDTLVVNASDINDDDRDDADADTTVDNTDTQDVVINAAAANYKVNITGSQVVDTITGTNLADTIDGQAGNDVITGGLGSDVLTGGAGADTFVYTAVAQSDGNATSTDTIADFVTGSDKVRLTINDAVNTTFNFGTFASVSSSGDGDNSLQGTNPVRVVGDGFYDAGADKLIIDVDGDGDITTTNDYQISSAGTINAADVNFVVNATNVAGVTVRSGQGADRITTGVGNDTIVMVGNLTAADVNGYVAAGSQAAVGIAGTIGNVLSYSELTATNGTATEARAGEVIDGDAGADNLHIFGTADLSGVTLNNIETLTVHSTVTLTLAQLYSLQNIVLSGDTAHAITITANDGTALTVAQQQAALSALPNGVTVTGSGVNTSVTIGGTTVVAAGSLAANGANDGAAATAINNAVNAQAVAGVTSVVDLAAGDDTGASNADNITNQLTGLSFSTTIADTAGVTVTLFEDADNDGVLDASETSWAMTKGAVVAGTATYSTDIALTEGSHNLRAFVTRTADGIRSDVSNPAVVVVGDVTAPAVTTITDNIGAAVTNAPVTFTVTFNEALGAAPIASDFNVTNGTIGAINAIGGNAYTVVVTPTAGLASGNVTLGLKTGDAGTGAGVQDVAGNWNGVSAVQGSQAVDTLAPTITAVAASAPVGAVVSAGTTYLNSGDQLTLTATLSEALTVGGTFTLGLNNGQSVVLTVQAGGTTDRKSVV